MKFWTHQAWFIVSTALGTVLHHLRAKRPCQSQKGQDWEEVPIQPSGDSPGSNT